ncbi:cobalt transporter [Bifidobacterium tissieri]|uniref:Cobalt transporter n=1 Tax=Bifidobacterium tissieri TaxID=1630162 RepID=A0A5M9ZT55_9BIFI|nr:cobalt transporter [Bifidobacterium tissieri]KAA8830688.1 cobalt transporter [Bifidobacterium tissieri]KAA8831752.1 cobalt transporter [Bifidobacterium tissieri]
MGRYSRYGRAGRRGGIGVVVAVMCTVVAAVTALALVAVLINLRRADTVAPRSAADAYCSAGSGTIPLSPTQASNAALIARIAMERGLPDHAVTVAIATAMQESKLTNIDYGDLDSVGLFQQRPSQGWGSVEQLMDESYAINAFYDALVKVPDWQSIPTEDAAQEVQRSGYPDLYANWDDLARAWAQALTGEVAAGAGCALEPAGGSDRNGLVNAIGTRFPMITVSDGAASASASANASGAGASGSGSSAASASGSGSLVLSLPSGLSDGDARRLVWQCAVWLVAQARGYGVVAVRANGMEWDRTGGVWSGEESAGLVVSVALA